MLGRLRLFLTPEQRRHELQAPQMESLPLSRAEWTTLFITITMMMLWVTEAWHDIKIATVSVLGALALMAPFGGVIKWKDGVKAVSWDLVIFVGAALVLGKSLIETGAANWIIEQLFAASGLSDGRSVLLILLGLTSSRSRLTST